MLQLDPALPVHVIGRGNGLAHALIDYGLEHDLVFLVAMDATGEFWCVRNPEVRARWNLTMGRVPPADGAPCPPVDATTNGH